MKDLESVYLQFLCTLFQDPQDLHGIITNILAIAILIDRSLSLSPKSKTKYSSDQTCTTSIAHLAFSFALIHSGVVLDLDSSSSLSRFSFSSPLLLTACRSYESSAINVC